MKKYWRRKTDRERHKRMRWGLLLLSVFMGSIMLTGCGRSKENKQEQERYVAVICKGKQHEFWKTVEQGARDAGEELGIRITFEAPENEEQIDVQIQMVEKAISQKADAIVLAPLDTDKLNDVIEKADKAGIPVLTFDSDVSTEARIATIGTNNEVAGAIAARNALRLIGDEGEIAIISYMEGAQTAIDRNEGFIREIENSGNKDVKIIGTKYCGGDAEVAKKQAKKLIEDYPELKCIYATNEGCALGVAAAVKECEEKSTISVIGFDSSEKEIAYLTEGAIDGIVVQNPYNMGYLGVRNINKVLDGESIEKKIDTGATYIDEENLEDEDSQWLLYPLA